MRLGARRRIHIRCHRYSKGKISFVLLLLLLAALLFFCAAYFLQVVRPLMTEIAANHAEVLAEQTIHRAVNELLREDDYGGFITISRLEDGTVSSLEANMMRVNQMKAEAAIRIQEAMSAVNETVIELPLGTLTGYELLAGVGPRMRVQLMPYGRVAVNFKSDFAAVGVNQTRLTVSLEAKATVGIALPTARISREIVTELPVEQTIIVGKVPDNYVNIDRMGEAFEGDVLDIVG